MASLAKTIHTHIKTVLTAETVSTVHFDVTPLAETRPNTVMYPIADEQKKLVLCDQMGGEARYQFDAYGLKRFDLFEKHDALMKVISKIKGSIGDNYIVWKVDCSGVRSIGTTTDDLYRYTFEATFRWGLII